MASGVGLRHLGEPIRQDLTTPPRDSSAADPALTAMGCPSRPPPAGHAERACCRARYATLHAEHPQAGDGAGLDRVMGGRMLGCRRLAVVWLSAGMRSTMQRPERVEARWSGIERGSYMTGQRWGRHGRSARIPFGGGGMNHPTGAWLSWSGAPASPTPTPPGARSGPGIRGRRPARGGLGRSCPGTRAPQPLPTPLRQTPDKGRARHRHSA